MTPRLASILHRAFVAAALFCTLGAGLAILLTRSPDALVGAASWIRLPVFLFMPVGLAASVLFGVRYRFFEQRPADKKLLLISTVAVCCAMGAAPLTNGAVGMLTQRAQQRIAVGRDFVRITGGDTAANLGELLQQLVDDSVPLNRVELDNGGGDVNGAIAAARWLRRRGVDRAVITGRCASACAYMALMFPQRYLAPGGSMGFHDITSLTGDKQAAAEGRATLIASIIANGVNEVIAQGLFATRELRWPSQQQLLQDNLITSCWDPKAQAPAPCL